MRGYNNFYYNNILCKVSKISIV